VATQNVVYSHRAMKLFFSTLPLPDPFAKVEELAG
jgi:hypothetical protein